MVSGPLKSSNISLFLLDVVGLGFAISIAHSIRVGSWLPDSTWALILVIMFVFLSLYVMNLYTADSTEPLYQIFTRLIIGCILAGGGLIVFSYVIGVVQLRQNPLFWRSVMPFALSGFALWACLHRYLLRNFIHKREQKRHWLVIGAGERAKRFVVEFNQSGLSGAITVHDESYNGINKQKSNTGLQKALNKNWTGVIVAADTELDDETINTLMQARLRGVRVLDLTEFYEYHWQKIPLFHVRDDWIIYSDGFRLLHYGIRSNLKKLVDYVFAVIISFVTMPFLFLIAVAIKLDSHGAVIYRQSRIGKGRQEINVYKLRTMIENAETEGEEKWAEEGDERITRVGRFLRRYRLDELPQFWNVLRGEMSCFGPRPERPDFSRMLEREIPYYDLRYLIKPGITGWAQVMHPYGASVEAAWRKLEYDLYYIKNHSLLLDLFIAIKTIRVMAFGSGR